MTELVRREQPSQEVSRMTSEQLRYIAGTDFVPRALRGKLPAILACVQTGRELGLGDMEALRLINVIDGRASMSAELMASLVRRNGHSISGSFGDGAVTVKGQRADTGDEMEVTWTRDMAARAGLLEKTNWKKYPESMLWARAVSQLCRALFPDCLGGVSHTPDEVELTVEERIDEGIGEARPMLGSGPDDDAEVVNVEPGDVEEPPAQGSFFEEQARRAQERAAARDQEEDA